LLYVSSDIKCVAVDELNRLKCESLWVELQEHTGASLTLGVCYRSQSAADSEIREMFTAIGQASKGLCLIVGDFNYPTINSDELEGNNKDEEEFLDVLQDNFLLQHV